MSGMKSIKILAYSAPITGLVLFIRGVQSLVLSIDWICRDFSDQDVRSVASFYIALPVSTKDVRYE